MLGPPFSPSRTGVCGLQWEKLLNSASHVRQHRGSMTGDGWEASLRMDFFTHPPPFWIGAFHTEEDFSPSSQPWSFWSRASLSNWGQCTGREQDAELDTPSFNPHPQPRPPWALEQVTCLPKPLCPPHWKQCNNTYFLVSLTRLNEIIMLALIYWVLTIRQAFGSMFSFVKYSKQL